MTTTRPKRPRRRIRMWVAASVAAVVTATGLAVLPQLGEDDREPVESAPAAAPGAPLDETAAMREARGTGKRVEATARRTTHDTTYANPDGTFTLDQATAPVRVRTASGSWTAIDASLKSDGKGGLSTKATTGALTFSAGTVPAADDGDHRDTDRAARAAGRAALDATPPAAGSLVRFTTAGHTVVLDWPQQLPAPRVAGVRALYPEVLPGVDLLLTAKNDGFAQSWIVKSREAAANPAVRTLALSVSSRTLTLKRNAAGGLTGTDASGTEVVTAPTPVMWDSSGRKDSTGDEGAAPDRENLPGGLAALHALEGPEPGTHSALVDAELEGSTLTLRPDTRLLDDPKTTYPVFIDPSINGHTQAWTLAYKRYATSNFWNGAGFNGGTDEARAGYENQSGGTGRSFFRVGWTLKGAIIKSSTFRLYETHSWSCSKRSVELWLTGGISSSTTWNNQPSWSDQLDARSEAHGYSSSCPDDYIGFDAKAAAVKANTSGWSNITLGVRAASETDVYAWKKFKDTPVLSTTYNRPPSTPGSLTTSPGGSCSTKSPGPVLGIGDVTVSAKATDPDGNLDGVRLKIWQTSPSGGPVLYDAEPTLSSTGAVSRRITAATFPANSVRTYAYQARARDSENAYSAYSATCYFTVDSGKPNPPTLSSTVWPEWEDQEQWGPATGTAGRITFSGGGNDVADYWYSVDTTSYDKKATLAGGVWYVDFKPVHAGPNVIYAKTKDKAGNWSDRTVFLTYAKPRDGIDGPGDTTGDQLPDLFVVDGNGDLRLYANLAKGDVNYSLDAAGQAEGKVERGYWTGALITHNGDYWGADGLQDLIARMPDGKLWIYPGNGLGGVDVARRTEMLLPAGSPDPADLSQIVSVGDIDGDRKPDMLGTVGDAIWAFLGYTGGSVSKSVRMSSSPWLERDIVSAGDHNKDGAVDLVYRTYASNRLLIRFGKKEGNGTSLTSLAAAVNSLTGKDEVYGTGGWDATNVRLLTGTPDADGDGIPDMWAVMGSDVARFYPGGAQVHGTPVEIVSASDGVGWHNKKAIG
ncbi:VCBS repeat-containing protein [Streptomyces sp. SCL15-6]|uniref:VCBS repeat-containing protein n=1 Tax=Streptomyces sp. SCL15-6 TaxID=2967222 RepID=UPI002965D8B0|nr:VCBS repeat-containing protein [Streptomyces sp. SCL15-6]